MLEGYREGRGVLHGDAVVQSCASALPGSGLCEHLRLGQAARCRAGDMRAKVVSITTRSPRSSGYFGISEVARAAAQALGLWPCVGRVRDLPCSRGVHAERCGRAGDVDQWRDLGAGAVLDGGEREHRARGRAGDSGGLQQRRRRGRWARAVEDDGRRPARERGGRQVRRAPLRNRQGRPPGGFPSVRASARAEGVPCRC